MGCCMPSHTVQGVLLDIEGTTSSIRFVYDEMFPFVRRELDGYLAAHWGEESLRKACSLLAADAAEEGVATAAWDEARDDPDRGREWIANEVRRQMDADRKATGLKKIQGLIWKRGFESGELRAHVYDDVPPALEKWNAQGLDVRIYSSGSVQAQHLFFGHTIAGDLLPHFRGHYDTTIGSKREAESYLRIAAEFDLPAEKVVFLSDIPAELEAAREAGMQVVLCERPGNAAVPAEADYERISDFSALDLAAG